DHVGRAKFWDLCACFHRRTHDGGALGHRDTLAVDSERDKQLGFGARGAEIGLFDERHDGRPYSAASTRIGAGPKSSRKCLSALMTGYGVKPPSAQSEPNFMVLQRSSTSARLSAVRSPSRILSMVSTPRVEPIRHGV